ncbi:hypothetical protein [Planococcus halotolerans]|uniref:hypothetical protein n=1 Tax=Planococcus halotolerans TaxID=2233542 RepID=UPI0013670483|nr:hypothetical protein [Planococcus halotolerans]QHJ70210.1 hypothetical protein DNR44_006170 [Planococcus halotolerans]
MQDRGEVSARAGKSKTVKWMAFREAKCVKGGVMVEEWDFLGKWWQNKMFFV